METQISGTVWALIFYGAPLNLAYFNHNAIYHVVQGVALALFFKSALWYVDREHEEQSAIEETIIPLVQIAR